MNIFTLTFFIFKVSLVGYVWYVQLFTCVFYHLLEDEQQEKTR